MELYFENMNGTWRKIADCATDQDAYKAIDFFLKQHNYKSHYLRTWDTDGWKNFDVGSWSEFFHLKISNDAVVPD